VVLERFISLQNNAKTKCDTVKEGLHSISGKKGLKTIISTPALKYVQQKELASTTLLS